MRRTAALSTLILFGLTATGWAITVDGTKDAAYGAPNAIQTIETGFGDNFSEWNAAYARIVGDELFLMLTGNLEGNFNKLEILIDSVPGGSNVFPNTPGNDGAAAMAGLTFDPSFTPEYHLIARRGNAGSDKFDLDIAELGTANFDAYFEVFGASQEGAAATGTGTVNANPIQVAYDNSNVAGIGGNAGAAADQAAALAVDTGLELGIKLADLGATGGPISFLIFQNNQGHDFLSNQSLPGLPVGFGNLGGNPGGLDFGSFGVSSATVVPEPTSLIAIVFALVGLTAAGRRAR